MVVDGEVSRFPGAFVVAGFAVAAILPARKLPSVLVLMTVQTARKRDMGLEVLALVTILTGHGSMFAEQRIVRLAVVKRIARENLLPPAGCVATLAVAAKCIAVRAFV